MNFASKKISPTKNNDTLSENESSYYTLTNKCTHEKTTSNKMYKFKNLVNKWSNISMKEDRIKPIGSRDFEVIYFFKFKNYFLKKISKVKLFIFSFRNS